MEKKIYCNYIGKLSKIKFIEKFFYQGTPTTTFDKKGRDIQCEAGRARSFDDIWAVFSTRFKTATKKELAKMLVDLVTHRGEDGEIEHKTLQCLLCPDISKLVFIAYGHQGTWWSFYNNDEYCTEQSSIKGSGTMSWDKLVILAEKPELKYEGKVGEPNDDYDEDIDEDDYYYEHEFEEFTFDNVQDVRDYQDKYAYGCVNNDSWSNRWE